MYESWYLSTLWAKLSPWDTTLIVATAPTITAGRVFIKNGTQKEWISFSWVSGTTLTGLVRQLSKTANPSVSTGNWYTFTAWTQIKIVAMHDDISSLSDILANPHTYTWEQTFTDINVTWVANLGSVSDLNVLWLSNPQPNFADTTARDLVYTSPVDWDKCTVAGTSQTYNGYTAQRESYGVSTPLPSATESVEGKAALASNAEALAWANDTKIMTPLKTKAVIDDTVWVYTFTAWENMNSWQVFRQWRGITRPWDAISQLTYDANDSRGCIWYDTTNQKAWQWYTSSWWLLTQIWCRLQKSWTPTGNITCVVRNTASGSWTIVATSTNTIAESTLTTWYWGIQNFTFNNVDLAPWTYFIELQVDRGNSTTNYSTWVFISSSPYAWGTLYTINSAWTRTSIAIDHAFTVTATALTEAGTKVYKANSQSTTFNKVLWAVKSTVVADATFNWVIWLNAAWYTWLTIWEVYYLKDDWTIWTTAWTTSIKIWRAISATEINFVPPL